MARPKKLTVDYFPHTCNHGKTMFIVEQRFGNDGYAFWYKLLELLGSTEGHYIDFNDSEQGEYLCAKTRLDEGFCVQILDLLAKLDAIDKELWAENRIIWCQNFVDGIAEVYKKRGTETPLRPSFCDRNNGNGEVSGVKSTQSKVKYSIVNNINTFRRNSDEFRLAELLFQKILLNNPSFKKPDLQSWAKHINRMLRIDNRDPTEIEKVITWCQKDAFWHSNILSTQKLRMQFDQLKMKMNGKFQKENENIKIATDGRVYKDGS